MVPLTVPAALGDTHLAEGQLSHPQVAIVVFVRRPVALPPRTLLENDLEYTNITPKAALDPSWLQGVLRGHLTGV